jgi:hypothetical protein
MKFLDLGFKLSIMKKIASNINLEEILPDLKIGYILRYLNVIMYPFIFLLSVGYLKLLN